jgi:aminoglycoside phosphotransferase (APT) family kinase protein
VRDGSLDQDPTVRDAIIEVLGETPREIHPLAGATSARLYRIRLQRGDVVMRRFLPERWETPVSELSAREYAILEALASSDLPAPHPLALLPENGVVMSFLPGRVWLPELPVSSWLDETARALYRIHTCGVTVPHHYQSWNDARGKRAPDWWHDAGTWSRAQQLVAAPPPAPAVLLHRDYHPVNLLWEEERISGVVDWINACMGPRDVDVAHCRLNLALMYGMDAADAFLDTYRHYVPGYRHDPYWDVDDAMSAPFHVLPYAPWAEFGLTGLTAEILQRRLEDFVQAALAG